jgi:NAD(P)-dependent dehydrogenase (short-subunit alcohol dehydrogenase family)
MRRTWLVTGCSRGLGRHIAAAVLGRGDHLVATARDPTPLADLVRGSGGRAVAVGLDVTRPDQARHAVEVAVERYGRLDVLVNNAGSARSMAIEDTTLDEFRTQIETNLFGVVTLTKMALPVLRRQGGGHILQISSVAARLGGVPGLGAYQAAKCAVEGFSEVLAGEVAPLGIKVVLIEPGALATDFVASSVRDGSVSPPYRGTVGHRNATAAGSGAAAADPARAAQVITSLVEHDQPPLRLLLGSDALARAERHAGIVADEARRWSEVTRSVDASNHR